MSGLLAQFAHLHERSALIGVVHLEPLPGSPGWGGQMSAVLDGAQRDAEALVEGGCDAIIVENMGDVPYLRGHVYPETTAAMALAAEKVVSFGLPVGIQLLAAANREALGVAVAAGARFIRAEAFAYSHVADEGWLDACAGELLRAKAALGSQVEIWTDIKKKHAAHAVTADVSLEDIAKGTAFCGAQTLIVTGVSTGAPTSPDDLLRAQSAGLPLAVGSGVNPDNIAALAPHAQGLIVGSWLKRDGHWKNPVCAARTAQLKARLLDTSLA